MTEPTAGAVPATDVLVNDIHSQLNPTRVRKIVAPRSLVALRQAVWEAGDAHAPLAIAGGRHAMGGQQFLAGERLLDTTRLDRVLRFDREKAGSRPRRESPGPRLCAGCSGRKATLPRAAGRPGGSRKSKPGPTT